MNEKNRAVLLAARPLARPTPPAPTLPDKLNPFEGRQLWQDYCVLFQAKPIKK